MRRLFNRTEKKILGILAKGHCQICGKELPRNWHADHVMPYSKGGKTILKNGQALCPECNLTKGNSTMKQWTTPLRKWQEEAKFKIKRRFDEGYGKTFLLVAFPGSGKTILALYTTYEWLMSNNNRFVVVVVPTEHLERQFHEDADRMNIRLAHKIKLSGGIDGYPDNAQGIVLTYSKLNANAGKLAEICRSKETLVIMDECHHIAGENLSGETKSWGEAVQIAFDYAAARLMMTGTAWRSDNHQIPFASYDNTNRIVSDYEYNYSDALHHTSTAREMQDKIAREILFVKMSGNVEFFLRDGFQTVDITPKLESELVSKALRTAYDPDLGQWFRQWFKEADRTLMAIRTDLEHPYPHASGLVIASSKQYAIEYAKVIRDETGESPTLVHYEEADASDKIRKYKENPESSPRWIVSVNMISEGTDIPRLSVLMYATIVRQKLYFFQAIGRVIRWDKGGASQQYARVYIPWIQPLEKYANSIKEQILHVIKQIIIPPPPPPPPNQEVLFAPRNNEFGLGGASTTMNDQSVDDFYVKKADEAIRNSGIPVYGANVRELVAFALKEAGGLTAVAPTEKHSGTWQDEIESDKGTIERLTSAIRVRFFPDHNHADKAKIAINAYLKNRVIGKPRNQWSDSDVALAYQTVQSWYEDNFIPSDITSHYNYLKDKANGKQ